MDTTRREYLAAAAGTAAIGFAGCLGSAGGGGDNQDMGDCDVEERDPVQELPAPTKGEDGAPVTVQVFKDFSCPHCSTFELDVLPKLESEYVESGDVLYEHRDFPIPVSETWSWSVASAARGVQDAEGDETFFEYARKLFSNQDDYSMDLVQNLAGEVGADGCEARAAGANETYRPVLEADRRLGEDMSLSGTPAVFVNERLLDDWTYESVKGAVDSAL
ncbi:DsbA family protein [Halegenticoccus tardaugens]|uniref:DsbA family protein n=1 Tax=Halegenticoccus tardaugens TaxID=2071624 RepID=UPI00100BF4E7|nr:thioredoxin domain-containing protein [Halegenticoccus tardaugens]